MINVASEHLYLLVFLNTAVSVYLVTPFVGGYLGFTSPLYRVRPVIAHSIRLVMFLSALVVIGVLAYTSPLFQTASLREAIYEIVITCAILIAIVVLLPLTRPFKNKRYEIINLVLFFLVSGNIATMLQKLF